MKMMRRHACTAMQTRAFSVDFCNESVAVIRSVGRVVFLTRVLEKALMKMHDASDRQRCLRESQREDCVHSRA